MVFEFLAELCVHFPGREKLDKPAVFLVAKVSVCLQCGSAGFTVPATDLSRLREDRGEVPKIA